MTDNTEKLPQPEGNMKIPEGIVLEVFHMLIEAGTITEKAAVKKYKEMKAKYPDWSQY